MPDIGDYTAAELREMSREDFEAAQAREFAKPGAAPAEATLSERGEISLGSSVKPRPAPNVWASKLSSTSYEFTVPSGQTCRLRRLAPEKLLEAGILDKIGILESLADKLVSKSNGEPPVANTVPTSEEFALLLETINLVVPMVVIEPVVYADSAVVADGEEVIRVSDIDLDDRMAILEESVKGITKLSSFRQPR